MELFENETVTIDTPPYPRATLSPYRSTKMKSLYKPALAHRSHTQTKVVPSAYRYPCFQISTWDLQGFNCSELLPDRIPPWRIESWAMTRTRARNPRLLGWVSRQFEVASFHWQPCGHAGKPLSSVLCGYGHSIQAIPDNVFPIPTSVPELERHQSVNKA